MKKLTKKVNVKGSKQSVLFNSIKRVAWHLSNNVENASGLSSERQKNYYKIYNNLKALCFLTYDKQLKQSTIQVNYEQFITHLDKLIELKRAPATLTGAKSKSKSKTNSKTKRV